MVLRCFSRRFLVDCRTKRIAQTHQTDQQWSHKSASLLSRRHAYSQFSTSTTSALNFDSNFNPNLRTQTQAEESEGIRIGSSTDRGSGSGSGSGSDGGSDGDGQSSSSSSRIYPTSESNTNSNRSPSLSLHPGSTDRYPGQIKNLLATIYSAHSPPSPHAVWNAYLNLSDPTSTSNSSPSNHSHSTSDSTPLINQLKLEHHRLVLRAVSPSVLKDRKGKKLQSKRWKLKSKLKSRSESESDLDLKPRDGDLANKLRLNSRIDPDPVHYSDSEIETYLERVSFILSQIHLFQKERISFHDHQRGLFNQLNLTPDSSPNFYSNSNFELGKKSESFPDLADYNHIFSILSKTHHLDPFLSLWNRLVNDGMRPNRESYHHLLECLHRNQSFKIKELNLSHQQERIKSLVEKRGEGRSSKSALKKTIYNHGHGIGVGVGKDVNEELIRFSRLNSGRTLGIIEEMKSDSIEIDSHTIDLILRNLRISGDVANFQSVLKEWFGIDLENPDEILPSSSSPEARQRLRPTIHTLNTILMLLAEQSSISKMVSVFESMVNPLPLKREEILKVGEELDERLGLVGEDHPDDEGKGKNLFAIDWSVFKKEDNESGEFLNQEQTNPNREVQEESSDSSKASHETSSSKIPIVFPSIQSGLEPNSKSYEILLRNLGPLKNVIEARIISDPLLKSTEERKKLKGDYIPVSKYLLLDLEQNSKRQFETFLSGLKSHLESFENPEQSKEQVEADPGSELELNLLMIPVEKLELKTSMIQSLEKLSFCKNGVPKNPNWDLIDWTKGFISRNLKEKERQISILEEILLALSSSNSSSSGGDDSRSIHIDFLTSQINRRIDSLESLDESFKSLEQKEIKARLFRNSRLDKRRSRIREMIDRNAEMQRKAKELEEASRAEKEKDIQRRKMLKGLEKEEEWQDEGDERTERETKVLMS